MSTTTPHEQLGILMELDGRHVHILAADQHAAEESIKAHYDGKNRIAQQLYIALNTRERLDLNELEALLSRIEQTPYVPGSCCYRCKDDVKRYRTAVVLGTDLCRICLFELLGG